MIKLSCVHHAFEHMLSSWSGLILFQLSVSNYNSTALLSKNEGEWWKYTRGKPNVPKPSSRVRPFQTRETRETETGQSSIRENRRRDRPKRTRKSESVDNSRLASATRLDAETSKKQNNGETKQTVDDWAGKIASVDAVIRLD